MSETEASPSPDRTSCRQALEGTLSPGLFRALCDPRRLELVIRLAVAGRPLTVTEASDCCEVHLSGVSRHLSQLKAAGVVAARRQGREVQYQLDHHRLVSVLRETADAIEACLRIPGCCEPTPNQASDEGEATMSENVHEFVKSAYTEALQRAKEGKTGCCQPVPERKVLTVQAPSTGCCGGDAKAEVTAAPGASAAQIVGYGEDADRHADAAATSFGCGNPLAFDGVEPGQTVVDLGSGAGLDLLIAADRVGEGGRVIGIDMTDAMIAAARENIAREGREGIVEVRKGMIEDLPVEAGSVDWVISNCVINLSPDKPAVYREIARILKPGGRFSISDIVVEGLPETVRASDVAYASCVSGAVSEEEYLAGLREAGLEVEVADRMRYEPEQIVAMVAGDFVSAGLDPADLQKAAEEAKVESLRFVGRRPA
ncbi:MAG: metalloregulator ArsR/SmtB family transcription factor [Deltaproteobacteria bacterium]|nr:metalloregulator ArsR/SmtB family transcription factor [Deltaproteobacteria bacterium]